MTAADAIEAAITRLVQQAPALDTGELRGLVDRLAAIATPLAAAIARVLVHVVAHRDQAGVALPALAMACATLADGLRGRLGERELEAARYEIETLLPVPGRAAPALPDVPLAALTRGPRPRT